MRRCAALLLFAGTAVVSLEIIVNVDSAHLFAFPQDTSTAAASPANPVTAIIDAFRTHDIVTLTDPHGNMQMQAFVLSLVRDGRFSLR